MSFPGLRDWNKGDSNRDRGHFQEPVDAIRQLQQSTARPAGGQPDTNPNPVEIGLAKIVNAGPNGATNDPDFTDARYWIQRLAILFSDIGDAVTVAVDITDQISYNSPSNIFVATNWPERNAGSHLLTTDGKTEVMYIGFYDAGSPQQKHYIFYAVATTDYSVYIASADSTGGRYTGYCFKTVPLDSFGFPTPSLGTPCLIVNDDEQKSGGAGALVNITGVHWGIGSVYSVARFDGEYSTDVPPKMILHVTNLPYQPVYAGGSAIPLFVGQTWSRENPEIDPISAGATAALGGRVKIQVPTTNAGHYREWVFDRGGRLYSIGAEV